MKQIKDILLDPRYVQNVLHSIHEVPINIDKNPTIEAQVISKLLKENNITWQEFEKVVRTVKHE